MKSAFNPIVGEKQFAHTRGLQQTQIEIAVSFFQSSALPTELSCRQKTSLERYPFRPHVDKQFQSGLAQEEPREPFIEKSLEFRQMLAFELRKKRGGLQFQFQKDPLSRLI